MIDQQTKLFAVIGNPLEHSLSPLMHNIFLQQQGINGVYLALPVEADRLDVAVNGLEAIGIGGINVTIPYKEAVIPLMTALTPAAERCQAVNTIIPTTDGLIGDNTDGAGLMAALAEEHSWEPAGKSIALIGAGGAAKGIAAALAAAGASRIIVANRHIQRAIELATWIDQLGDCHGEATLLEGLSQPALFQQVDTFINTTSVGMSPHIEEMPPLAVQYLNDNHLVVDIIYNPLETQLLTQARQQGAKVSSGLGMFIHQGALSFEKWLGVKPETKPLYAILQAELLNKNGR